MPTMPGPLAGQVPAPPPDETGDATFDLGSPAPPARPSFLGDLVGLLVAALAGALGGLGAGLFAGRGLVSALAVRSDSLALVQDLAAVGSAERLLGGFGGVFLPIAGLVLAVLLLALAVVVTIRRGAGRGPALLRAAVGLAVGLGLAAVTLLAASGTERTVAAMTAARLGEARILAAVLWPRILYFALFGSAAGWILGAALAAGWLRRVLLALPGLGLVVAALVVALSARPGTIDLPADAPHLETGDEGAEVQLYVIGGTKQALPVTMGLAMFLQDGTLGGPVKMTRRNVGRAQKATEVLPLLLPEAAAAERLLVAGALADLNPEGAVEHLWTSFSKRGNSLDGMVLATSLGRLAPSESASRYLDAVTDPAKVHVGPAASKRLCPLALAAGNAAAASRLRCSGQPTVAATGTVTASLALRSHALRRAAVGLVAEPSEQEAAWVKAGQVSAAALALVAGGRTDAAGAISFGSVLPGTYVLAVAPPRRRGPAEPLELDHTVRIVVPPEGGAVDLGTIAAGGPPPAHREGPPRGRFGVPSGPGADGLVPDLDNGPELPPEGGEAEAGYPPPQGQQGPGGPGATGQGLPGRARPTAPGQGQEWGAGDVADLPPTARRLVSKVRPAGPNRVFVPEGFGQEILEADRSAISPLATVAPVDGPQGRGLRLAGIRDAGLPVALGFREGDVIESVNGRAVTRPEDLVELVDQLAGQRRVSVRLRREGQPLVLRIEVER